jgi:hypothetical protein
MERAPKLNTLKYPTQFAIMERLAPGEGDVISNWEKET